MSKNATLLLIAVLAVSSLIMVGSAFAQSIPKPSVPEFTLKFEAHPYDVPPTYGIDPYTGENVTIAEGGHVENKSIVVTIKNQHSSGDLYYNVRYKGSFEDSWTELYYYEPYSVNDLPRQSNSEYTVLSLLQEALPPNSFVDRAQVDVQVEALLWHNVEIFISDHPTLPSPYYEIGHYETRYALNETSGWSSTQTIIIPASSSSSSSSPTSPDSTTDQTAEPTNEAQQTLQLAAITGTVIAVVVVGAVLLVYFRKRKH
jgi:hypothetical protein